VILALLPTKGKIATAGTPVIILQRHNMKNLWRKIVYLFKWADRPGQITLAYEAYKKSFYDLLRVYEEMLNYPVMTKKQKMARDDLLIALKMANWEHNKCIF
jgi:hypothetical protein